MSATSMSGDVELVKEKANSDTSRTIEHEVVADSTPETPVEETMEAVHAPFSPAKILPQLAFPLVCIFAEIVMVACYAVFTKYGDVAIASSRITDIGNSNGTVAPATSELDHFYPMFQDVHVMIFVGFGFLMTFLKKYGYSSVGLNFVVSALVIQWSILSNSFWHQLLGMKSWHKVELVIETLITADFAAGAVLITFGAVLGKVTPAQLMIIALIEVSVYGINESIGAGKFGAVDMGGSIFVHTFGAYFGLACSLGLGLAFTRNDSIGDLSKPTLCCATARRSEIDKKMEDANKENEATKTSDMMAMIGTLFLWMFWPSFNGALATESQQHRVVINTLLSLCACCVSAFMFSALLRGLAQQISNGDSSHYKFDMVDIQNATLAGGVAVGSSADLVIEPWGAIVIGIIAGFVSVAGYVFVQPFLQRAIGLHDTCGVHNLHGMPGILGGIAGMISAMTAGEEKYGQSISTVFPERANGRTAAQQGGYQIAALVLTMAMACSGGFLTGIFIRLDNWCCLPAIASSICCSQKKLFEDDEYWVVPESEDSEGEHVGTGHGAHSHVDTRADDDEGVPGCISITVKHVNE